MGGQISSFRWSKATSTPQVIDGSKSTYVNAKDQTTAVKLAQPCTGTVTFKVFGNDKSVPSTDLRHIRAGFSSDGEAWKCSTTGDCCGFEKTSTGCGFGPLHGKSGMQFTVS